MVERRKPLVLASTKFVVNSVLRSSHGLESTGDNFFDDGSPEKLEVPVGILRFSQDANEKLQPQFAALDHSSLLALSTSLLRTLSITSASLVVIIL